MDGQWQTAAFLLGGALAGGFVTGLAGFGTGLAALGIWLHVIPPGPASTLTAICSVVAQIQSLPTVWHAVDRTRLWPIVASGLLGVPLGTWLLAYADPGAFRLAIGGLLLAYSAFMLLRRAQTRIAWGGRAADAAVGCLGGVMGGFSGLSGPPLTVWAALRGWGKDERRAAFQVYNMSVLTGVIAVHAADGLVTTGLAGLALVALPGTLAGAWLGVTAYRRLSDRRFGEVVFGLLGLSGLILILNRS